MMLARRHARTSSIAGFTLVEVLVALVIVSMGMIAVFSQLNQMLGATSRLRDKTFAHWIAVDQITELQANRAYPSVGQKSDEVDMANATWAYTVKTSQIGDLNMRRVDVTVAFADTPEDILAEVSGFLAAPQQAFAGNPGSGGGGGGGGGGDSPQGQGNATTGTGQASQAEIPGGPQNLAFGGGQPAGVGLWSGWDPIDPNEYAAQ